VLAASGRRAWPGSPLPVAETSSARAPLAYSRAGIPAARSRVIAALDLKRFTTPPSQQCVTVLAPSTLKAPAVRRTAVPEETALLSTIVAQGIFLSIGRVQLAGACEDCRQLSRGSVEPRTCAYVLIGSGGWVRLDDRVHMKSLL
jgi:hypothetical protein